MLKLWRVVGISGGDLGSTVWSLGFRVYLRGGDLLVPITDEDSGIFLPMFRV